MRFSIERPGVSDRHSQLSRRGFKDDSLLRFCIAYCSPETPFKDERDFEVRRSLAMDFINLSESETERIEMMIEKDHEMYREYMYEIFRLIHDVDYTLWFSLKSSFDIMSARLRSPTLMLDSDRRQITQIISTTAYELKQVEYRLFPDEEHLKRLLTEEATANSLGGFAEKFALNSPE